MKVKAQTKKELFKNERARDLNYSDAVKYIHLYLS